MSPSNTPEPSPVEAYLDELVRAMATLPPRRLRDLLAETEAHLWDATAEGVASGLSQRDAETAAVARFGAAETIAAAERDTCPMPLSVVVGQTVRSAVLLGGIAAAAVGVSGLLAGLVYLIFGPRSLADPTAAVLTRQSCARWLAADPGAHSCAAAALSDWTFEAIGYRIGVGILGVAALAIYWWLRRRADDRRHAALLPGLVQDTIATTGFAGAAVATLLLGIDAVAVSAGRGSGQWFSATPVAAVLAAVFGVRLLRRLRAPEQVRT
ncbi:MAG TPA: permease prefix domain 1-containing protein [Jatrophihabitans sp.]|nr:permease prefix domain 1-containing protein [Jatrophihabitans sp.]